MARSLLIISFLLFSSFTISQQILHYKENQTLHYYEIIRFYQQLDIKYQDAKLIEYGKTDAGIPLHLFVIDKSKKFDPALIKPSKKATLLINNGIHPGESCGIDASMELAKNILEQSDSLDGVLENIVVCIIPVYNIGGALNRGCCSRANQNGPAEYGFRGNSMNLDLNRDFIKCDSEESKTFAKIFHLWNPEIFIDTHVSNGADYQYNMTLLNTIPERLNKLQANLLTKELLPFLYKNMERAKYPICPYVNTINEIPDDGITTFLDNPRFATGYASLFNTIGLTTEAHMLKPYKNQVESTYQVLKFICLFTSKQHELLVELKATADQDVSMQKQFNINFKIDTNQVDLFQFAGFEASYKISNVTKLQRLYYNRSKPFIKEIKYFSAHQSTQKISLPEYYIIPQAYEDVINLLAINKVKLKKLTNDIEIEVEMSFIDKYNDVKNAPYENHYLHYATTTSEKGQIVKFYKGDIVVKTNQAANHFLAETLEPVAVDSYFNWNFFDGILQQKEWFSPYVFEEAADSLLRADKNLEGNFRQMQAIDSTFANSQWDQLYYIYKNSSYFEPTFKRYPIARVRKKEISFETIDYLAQ